MENDDKYALSKNYNIFLRVFIRFTLLYFIIIVKAICKNISTTKKLIAVIRL